MLQHEEIYLHENNLLYLRVLPVLHKQPISRKSEQIGNRSVKTCCQQADIWMRSLDLYLSVLTGPQLHVNRSVRSCCDRAAAILLSTDLSQVVVTELQQFCFQQTSCCKLLTHESCSNAVFNNLRQTCCKPRKAPYEACVSTILNKTRPNRLPYFGCSVS
jgi:hypothetical protein